MDHEGAVSSSGLLQVQSGWNGLSSTSSVENFDSVSQLFRTTCMDTVVIYFFSSLEIEPKFRAKTACWKAGGGKAAVKFEMCRF